LKRTLLQYISLGLSENIETSLYGQRMISDFALYHICNTEEASTKKNRSELNGEASNIQKDCKV
jgi:hypothetical protein